MVRDYHEDRIPAVYNRSELPATEKREGVEQQYFRGMNTLVGFTTAEAGITGQPHHHPWEQINFVVEGSCEFRVGDEVAAVREGDIFVIPPDVEHNVESVESSVTICFISPLREDYLPKTAYQEEFERFDHE